MIGAQTVTYTDKGRQRFCGVCVCACVRACVRACVCDTKKEWGEKGERRKGVCQYLSIIAEWARAVKLTLNLGVLCHLQFLSVYSMGIFSVCIYVCLCVCV